MLYLTEEDVRRLLPMPEAIRLMQGAFERLASGEAVNQPRRRLMLPTRSVLHYMAAGDDRYFGAKIYATNPSWGAHFLFLLYRAEDAAPLAIMEANYMGQIRTGAASGLATRLLARPDSSVLAVVGSGFQARTQVAAIAAVLPLRNVRVWSRSAEKRASFAAECSRELNLHVAPAGSAEAAVRGADVLVTATSSAEPVVDDAWVAPGTHINAMGSNQPRRRELPAELVLRSDVIVVDSIEQSRMESGDLLLALKESEWDRVIELRDAIHAPARTRFGQITLFKSNGLALEDVAAAAYVYEQAVNAGVGYPVHS